MHWFVQSPGRNREMVDRIANALKTLVVPYSFVELKPFTSEIPALRLSNFEPPYIRWGPAWVPRAETHPELRSSTWYSDDEFRWSAFSHHWSDLMITKGRLVPFSELEECLTDDPVFVRPDADSKYFPGGVYSKGQKPVTRKNLPDFDVVIGGYANIRNEYRLFILDNQVVAGSSYRLDGVPRAEALLSVHVVDFAKTVISLWQPADVFCLDIGETEDGIGIVEANCFNASRHYAADTLKIIRAVCSRLSASL